MTKADTFGLGAGARALIGALPWLLAIAYGVLLLVPVTHRTAILLAQENQVVELGTFVAFALAGVRTLVLAGRAAGRGMDRGTVWGFALLGIVFLVMAMEEVSWTQWFLHFETPAGVRAVNEQGEFNLHNLPVVQELNEWFLFGVGLVGLALSRRSGAGPLGVPRPIGSAFLLVAVVGGLELYSLQWPFSGRADEIVTYEVEVAELVLGGAALGYAWLNGRRRSAGART